MGSAPRIGMCPSGILGLLVKDTILLLDRR